MKEGECHLHCSSSHRVLVSHLNPQFIKKASSLMGAAKDEVLELQYKVRG